MKSRDRVIRFFSGWSNIWVFTPKIWVFEGLKTKIWMFFRHLLINRLFLTIKELHYYITKKVQGSTVQANVWYGIYHMFETSQEVSIW